LLLEKEEDKLLKLSVGSTKSGKLDDLLASRRFLVSDVEMQLVLWFDRLELPMEYLQLKITEGDNGVYKRNH